MIRSISPSKSELLFFRVLHTKNLPSSSDNAKVYRSTTYLTYIEEAVDRGLCTEGEEFHDDFDEAVRYQSTPRELLGTLVAIFQQSGDLGQAMNKKKSYLMSDIGMEKALNLTNRKNSFVESLKYDIDTDQDYFEIIRAFLRQLLILH